MLALAVFSAWFQTWRVDLRCEHVTDREIRCVSHSHSLLHETEETLIVRDVRGTRAASHIYGSRRGRPASSRRISWDTPAGDVPIAISNVNILPVDRVHAVAAELDAFARSTDAAPVSVSLRAGGFLRLLVGSLLLFLPALAWRLGRRTLIEVDRPAGSLTLHRRLYGWSMSQVSIPLDQVIAFVTERRGRFERIMLSLREGPPVLVDAVPRRRADAEVAALHRLLRA